MIGLLENFDVTQMAFEEAINSAGAVGEANEKRIDSLEKRTQKLKETYNEFLRSLTNSQAFRLILLR